MIRTLTLLALGASLAGFNASAAPAGVAQAFGNTIVSTYPDGRTGELYLQPGGTYSAKGRRGDMSSGHWTVKGANLCLKQSKPLAVPFKFCTGIPSGGMGSSWSAKAVTGESIRVKLVNGHFAGRSKT